MLDQSSPATTELPVAVIGAGPVGLAAAAQLLSRGLTPLVFEAGDRAGASILQWGHVRMFSPWRYNVERASARLLEAEGWAAPPPEQHPTGRELVERYVAPLAATAALRPHLRLRSRVIAVSRVQHDLMKDAGRGDAPFLLRVAGPDGEEDVLARAVIDASGTYRSPSPLGGHGLPVLGEREAAESIFYGIPDVLGRERPRYAGRRVLVVGSGHSAFNAILDLAALAGAAPGTEVNWALRRTSLARVLGGGESDALAERGRLGLQIKALVDSGAVRLHLGLSIDRLRRSAAGLIAEAGAAALPAVDEIVVATGFRPDLSILSELRLGLDAATQSPTALAPLIDPNVHSCGTVRPHGFAELSHPEPGLYIVGMKSYGRAPTFLLLTGYEQVRSVVAALAGDREAAARVELELPETGVCSTQLADDEPAGACCGAEPPRAAAPLSAPATASACGTGRAPRPAAPLGAPATAPACGTGCGVEPPRPAARACCI